MPRLMAYLLVFAGGGAGSMLRYTMWLLFRPWQAKFPWATLSANGLACLAVGAFLGWQRHALLSDQNHLLLVTGFCGGFSTYSMFTVETWGLWQSGHSLAALLNVLLNLGVCILCLLLGLKITA